jgi:hypothetical protein
MEVRLSPTSLSTSPLLRNRLIAHLSQFDPPDQVPHRVVPLFRRHLCIGISRIGLGCRFEDNPDCGRINATALAHFRRSFCFLVTSVLQGPGLVSDSRDFPSNPYHHTNPKSPSHSNKPPHPSILPIHQMPIHHDHRRPLQPLEPQKRVRHHVIH